jgi:hypothetical protein
MHGALSTFLPYVSMVWFLYTHGVKITLLSLLKKPDKEHNYRRSLLYDGVLFLGELLQEKKSIKLSHLIYIM